MRLPVLAQIAAWVVKESTLTSQKMGRSSRINCCRQQRIQQQRFRNRQRGFTLVELLLVIVIVGIGLGLVVTRLGTFTYWKQEGKLRELRETLGFLHTQAVADQTFYQVEFDFDKNEYRVGVLRAEYGDDEELTEIAADAGTLTLELAAFLSPSLGEGQSMIPPPTYPSLHDPVALHPEFVLKDIRTMRGKKLASDGGKAYIRFSPRGFSEFAVIHLLIQNDQPVTIFVNPFTGNPEIYREYKEFEWTFGRERKEQ